MIRVGVFGAAGRMGAEVCRAVDEDQELELVAAIDPFASETGQGKVAIGSDPKAMLDANTEVAVDFTVADSAFKNIKWCIENNIHIVVGTTGINSEQLAEIEQLIKDSSTNVFIAPNFAIGAVLMMEFTKKAAAWLPDVEIIELHHPGKLDAPSGTALKTLEGIIESRRDPSDKAPSATESLSGARGAEKDGVHIHSVRLPGLVAHQEVIFGGQGQTLSIRHDSTDRTSFMPGVLMAIKRVSSVRGLTVGLENLLDL